jgi:hypothetical protein
MQNFIYKYKKNIIFISKDIDCRFITVPSRKIIILTISI